MNTEYYSTWTYYNNYEEGTGCSTPYYQYMCLPRNLKLSNNNA
jgi:hypothetical protein